MKNRLQSFIKRGKSSRNPEIAIFSFFRENQPKSGKNAIFYKSFCTLSNNIKTASNIISRLEMTSKHISDHGFDEKNEFSKLGKT